MKIALEPISIGAAFKVYALVIDGRCEIQEFLNQMALEAPNVVAKLISLLDRVANHGPPKNIEKSRHVGGEVFEFKSNRLRVCYFYDDGRIVVCTHVFSKPAKKIQSREIKRADRLRKEYFSLKGEIVYLD